MHACLFFLIVVQLDLENSRWTLMGNTRDRVVVASHTSSLRLFPPDHRGFPPV